MEPFLSSPGPVSLSHGVTGGSLAVHFTLVHQRSPTQTPTHFPSGTPVVVHQCDSVSPADVGVFLIWNTISQFSLPEQQKLQTGCRDAAYFHSELLKNFFCFSSHLFFFLNINSGWVLQGDVTTFFDTFTLLKCWKRTVLEASS